MNRLLGMVVISLWLTSVGALVVHDMWPRWTAEPPPGVEAAPRDVQMGIFDARGGRIGAAWNSVQPSEESLSVESTTVLESVPMLPPLRVESVMRYFSGRLDDIQVKVFGLPHLDITLRGEHMGGGFPCELRIGPVRRTFAFDDQTMQAMGEAMRPFSVLPDLVVGRRWQVKLFNPIRQLVGDRADFESVVVEVTGKETIEHQGRMVECFRVEARDVVAFVDETGRVLEQRVRLPVIGGIVLRDEPYDEAVRQAARQRITR
jgi:hypothetical protein